MIVVEESSFILNNKHGRVCLYEYMILWQSFYSEIVGNL